MYNGFYIERKLPNLFKNLLLSGIMWGICKYRPTQFLMVGGEYHADE
jgi:hypothetical protein